MHITSPEASPPVETEPLSQRVAAEVLAELARRRLTRTDLAERIARPYHWLNDRLAGRGRLTLDDLQVIARGLDMDAAELIARADS